MKHILTVFLLIFSMNAFSQADDPADGDGTVPIDGGISLLIAAGTAYGTAIVRRKLNNRPRGNQ